MIETGNAVDRQHLLAARGTPLVQDLELLAHEALATVVGMRAHQLRLSDAETNAAIRPGLRDETQRRRDAAGTRVFDEAEVVRADVRMPPIQQVLCPARDAVVQLGRVLVTKDVGVERHQGVAIGRRRAADAEVSHWIS